MQWFRILLLLILGFSIVHAQDSTKRIKTGVLPILAYTPETSVVLGAAASIVFQNGDTTSRYYRPSSLSPTVIYTFRKQFLFNFRTNLFIKNKYNWYNKLEIVNIPTQYFGIGTNVSSDYEINTVRYFKYEPALLRNVTEQFFVGLGMDIDYYNIHNIPIGGKLDTDNPYGIDGGFQAGIGPAVKYDTRDNIFFPYKGVFINFQSFHYVKASFTDYTYASFSIEARLFQKINKNNIIAAHIFTGNALGDNVPFFKYELIGGGNRLRGITLTKYIDSKVYYIQTEYRKKIYKKFWINIFSGIGDVAPKVNKYNVTTVKVGYGIGLRYRLLNKERINIRVDYAFSNDQTRGLYVSLGEAF